MGGEFKRTVAHEIDYLQALFSDVVNCLHTELMCTVLLVYSKENIFGYIQ